MDCVVYSQKEAVSRFPIVISTRDVQLGFDEGPLGPFLVGLRRRGFMGLKTQWALCFTVSLKIQRLGPPYLPCTAFTL